MKRKRFKRFLITLVVLLVITELIARFVLGLGHVPVYIESKEFEYIYAPGQNVKRFGNRIITNEFSMRSKPLSKKDKLRILKLGDSIINGGSQTDHDSLASTILENELSREFHDSIRVLNIGANSWGPDNAFAYLSKYGDFDASMIVLVFSSHDLYDNMHHQKVVGVHPAWPADQPLCATSDGFFKYVMPWIKKKLDKNYNEYSYLGIDANNKTVNPGWSHFFHYAEDHKIPLLVYLHPEKSEAVNKKYDGRGQQIIRMLDSANVNYIEGIKITNDDSYYRDFIHLNNKGQKRMAEALRPFMEARVKEQLSPLK